MLQWSSCVIWKRPRWVVSPSTVRSENPPTFEYSIDVGPYPAFDDYTFTNTASFRTLDTQTEGSDNWTVRVKVPADGCTLTPGYWKTHSSYGPARVDARWEAPAGGADTPFFTSGQTYYEVLWTSPGGNAYYTLAHAYIAAQLNAGIAADFSAAQAAFDEAISLLGGHTPDEISSLQRNRFPRGDFIRLARVLDDFNSGVSGPGACSE